MQACIDHSRQHGKQALGEIDSFGSLLGLMFGVLLVYTGTVGAMQGWVLFSVFVRDISAMNWPGQFNLDFACFLLLASVRAKGDVGVLLLGKARAAA